MVQGPAGVDKLSFQFCIINIFFELYILFHQLPIQVKDYDVSPTSNDEWKTCKILGSLLDTKADIKRRKGLVNNAYNKLRPIFES